MAITAERLPGEPIVIVTILGPELEMSDPVEASQTFIDLTSDVEGTRVRIIDFSRPRINFGDVVNGLSADVVLRDPNTYSLLVGSDELVEFASKAASEQDQYGRAKTSAYSTIDDALAAARQIIAQNS